MNTGDWLRRASDQAGGAKPLPKPKSRAESLSIKMTFQGLTVSTSKFGTFPWFDTALFSPDLTPEDRQSVYKSKRAEGDTHCIIPYWKEPSKIYYGAWPYNVMEAPVFQGNRAAFLAAIEECLAEGFTPLVFLDGDDGENGYPIAVEQLPVVVHDLQAGVRDFTKEVIIMPGWDGVFYGWEPEHIEAWGKQFRELAPEGLLGIEHNPGHIPIGGGNADWAINGPMSTYDVVLSEFDFPIDPSLSKERNIWDKGHKIWTSPYEEAMGMIWQIGKRLLGPDYVRPPDQPSDNDSGGPNWYLAQGTPRGPYFTCAFEWVGEYYWVRNKQSKQTQDECRKYLKDCGWKWTG